LGFLLISFLKKLKSKSYSLYGFLNTQGSVELFVTGILKPIRRLELNRGIWFTVAKDSIVKELHVFKLLSVIMTFSYFYLRQGGYVFVVICLSVCLFVC